MNAKRETWGRYFWRRAVIDYNDRRAKPWGVSERKGDLSNGSKTAVR